MAGFTHESVQLALSNRFAFGTYPFPGLTGINIAVRLLKDAELDAVRLQAVVACKGKQVELTADPDFLVRIIRRETITRAFYDAADHKQSFFGSEDDVGELDEQTVTALYELYQLHAGSMDPYAHASEETVRELAETLGKSERPAETLSLFGMRDLRSLCLSLALALRATSATPK